MLGRPEIAACIPHAGRMRLLDRVIDWDAKRIRCAAGSHRAPDNPLRERGGLPVWAGIEYAAQAAAVHGALLRDLGPPRSAVLGKVRHVRAGCEWLDRIASEILLGATLLYRDSAGAIYAFEAHGDGAMLLEGQFTLMFTGTAPEPPA